MKTLAIAVTGTLVLSGIDALATELPSYELGDFPISPHQSSA